MGSLETLGILVCLLGQHHGQGSGPKTITLVVVAKPAYAAGEPINVSFVIGNDGQKPIYVSQGNLWQHVKIVLRNSAGREPLIKPLGLGLRNSYGAKGQNSAGLPLRAGHQLTFEADVTLQRLYVLKPGVYTISARLAAQPPDVPKEIASKPVKFTYGKVAAKREKPHTSRL